MIRLKSADFEKIAAHAAACLPNEACGLLAGRETDGVCQVEHVYLMTNTDASSEHFSIDPREQLAVIRDMRQQGWTLVGNWHSHPETPSRPSEEDIRLAFDSSQRYLILSLESRVVPNLNAFRIAQGEYQWEILELYD
jgi:proteasome lid subunit RPN8/RPN11